MKILGVSFIALFISTIAKADYRAYELKITDESLKTYRTFKSTLDPLQYKGFYILKPTETITYVSTWRCRGNTSFYKPICSN